MYLSRTLTADDHTQCWGDTPSPLGHISSWGEVTPGREEEGRRRWRCRKRRGGGDRGRKKVGRVYCCVTDEKLSVTFTPSSLHCGEFTVYIYINAVFNLHFMKGINKGINKVLSICTSIVHLSIHPFIYYVFYVHDRYHVMCITMVQIVQCHVKINISKLNFKTLKGEKIKKLLNMKLNCRLICF